MSAHIVALDHTGRQTRHDWPDDQHEQGQTLRRIVGGHLEVAVSAASITMWCCETGWLDGMPPNEPANVLAALIAPLHVHNIAGTVAITGRDGEHTTALGPPS